MTLPDSDSAGTRATSAEQSSTHSAGSSLPSNSSPDLPVQRSDTRQLLTRRRKDLSAASVQQHSQHIARQVLPLLHSARRIAGYLSIGNEVAVDEILAACRAQQRSTFVPLIQADHTLLFSPLDENTVIVQNKYGIREPASDLRNCILPTALDAVLVPLLGFDARCNRMGMGGGFYDRSFTHRRHVDATAPSQKTPLLIGVAHEIQRVDNITTQWWDVPLDMVVTEKRIYRRNSE